MTTAAYVALGVVAAVLVLGLAASIRIFKQYGRGVRFRLGKLRDGPRGPGLVFIIPIQGCKIEVHDLIERRRIGFDCPAELDDRLISSGTPGRFVIISMGGEHRVFDSFECAIQALAPRCGHCGCTIIGHGMEAGDTFYCGAYCAHEAGVASVHDRA